MKVLKRVIFILIVPMITFSVSGETLEELKDEYSTLIDKQESKMTMLNENYSIQDEIKKQIADIDNRLSDAHVDIDKIDSQMMEIIMKIDDAKKAYDEAVKNREEQYKKASKRLRHIYENKDENLSIDIIFNIDNISDYYIYKQYVADIMEYDAKLINDLKETENVMKKKLDEIKEGEEAEAALKNCRTEKEFEMIVMYDERNKLLEEYRSNADAMEAEIDEIKSASEKVYEIITGMEDNIDFVNAYTGGELEWPVTGRYYVSSDYVGRISPVGNGYEFHTGIDIPAPTGYEISAAEDGIVTTAGWINGYGNTVIINHGGGLSTLYGHNSEITVNQGDKIKRGDTVALCGSTGYATGSHCHFEVRISGEHTNPWEYLKRK